MRAVNRQDGMTTWWRSVELNGATPYHVACGAMHWIICCCICCYLMIHLILLPLHRFWVRLVGCRGCLRMVTSGLSFHHIRGGLSLLRLLLRWACSSGNLKKINTETMHVIHVHVQWQTPLNCDTYSIEFEFPQQQDTHASCLCSTLELQPAYRMMLPYTM